MHPLALRVLVAFAGGLLGCIALVQLGARLAAVLWPGELMYGEAIIYAQAARLLRGEPLYQPLDRPPYTVAAYTPLYYWLVAGLQRVVGGGFGPGRLLSLAAEGVATGVVALLAARGARSRWAGAFAALLFLALGLPAHPGWPPWSALYKEDVLGVALSLGAVAALACGRGRGGAWLGGLLAGLAVLTKQTFVAAGLAGTLWLLWRDRGRAAPFAGVAAGVVLLTGGALELATGAFVANTVLANANPIVAEALWTNLFTLARHQTGPLLVVAVSLLTWFRGPPVAAGLEDEAQADRGARAERELLTLYWGATLLPLLGLVKAGSNHNYWIETAAATAVLATFAIWAPLSRGGAQAYGAYAPVPALLLLVSLATPLLLARATAPEVLASLRERWPGAPQTEAVALGEVVSRVRTEPREVLALPLDVVALAGRPVLLEPYLFNILYSQGHWDAQPLVRRICAAEIGLLVVDRPLEGPGAPYHGYEQWPAPVMEALRATMELREERGGRLLYAPARPAASAGAGCPPHLVAGAG